MEGALGVRFGIRECWWRVRQADLAPDLYAHVMRISRGLNTYITSFGPDFLQNLRNAIALSENPLS